MASIQEAIITRYSTHAVNKRNASKNFKCALTISQIIINYSGVDSIGLRGSKAPPLPPRNDGAGDGR